MSYDVYIGDFSDNYTSNVGKLYHAHIMDGDGATGLQALDGKTGKQAHALIASALESIQREYRDDWKSGQKGAPGFCERYDAPNGWGTAVGALIFLSRIAAACAENARKTVRVSA